MPTTFTPPDYEFAAASGTNVNWNASWSYFDHPPNSTANLTITSNVGDTDAFLFETGEIYDLTWTGHGGGSMDDATIIRSDYLGPGQGAIVFEGINSVTGELYQVVWTPGFDLEAWYWDNGGSPSSPNAFWTSDQDAQEFQYVCYASGTLIETPAGAQPIETLKVGDFVETQEHGPKPIYWLRKDVQLLNATEKDKRPVLIAANALGKGRPAQDLIVSPQHRIFVGGHGQLQKLFKTEAFAPAKSLTKLRGIRHMKGKQSIIWYHFACDRHEIVTANGCLSESLLLGATVVCGLTVPDRLSVAKIFGPASTPDAALNGPPARECLSVRAAQRHLAKSVNEHKKQAELEITKWDLDLAMEQDEADLMREPRAMHKAHKRNVP